MLEVFLALWIMANPSAQAAAGKTDYSKCQQSVNGRLALMTNGSLPAEGMVDPSRLAVSLLKDGKFDLDNVTDRQGQIVRDGKNATISSPSMLVNPATKQQITNQIRVIYDDKDRIVQIEERPDQFKRAAIASALALRGPAPDLVTGIRLTYVSGFCEVEQSYTGVPTPIGGQVDYVAYDRKTCDSLTPTLKKLNREFLNKCNDLMADMAKVVADRMQEMIPKQQVLVPVHNAVGVGMMTNPYFDALQMAFNCRIIAQGDGSAGAHNRLDVKAGGSSSDDKSAPTQ